MACLDRVAVVLFCITTSAESLGLRGTFVPEKFEEGQCIGQFIVRYARVRKHGCAGMPLSDGFHTFSITFQPERFGIPEIGRRWVETRDQCSRIGSKARQLVSTAIDSVAVRASSFPVEHRSSRFRMSRLSFRCAWAGTSGRRLRKQEIDGCAAQQEQSDSHRRWGR